MTGVTVGDDCAREDGKPSRLAIIRTEIAGTAASLSKLREETPVMIRDTGAYCLRQTPILTLLAVVLLLVLWSLLRMNCSSVPADS